MDESTHRMVREMLSALLNSSKNNIIVCDFRKRSYGRNRRGLLLYICCRSWLEKSQSPRELVPSVVYTYLRLIVDHKESAFSLLRQREVDVCLSLLREKVRGDKCFVSIFMILSVS